jgi:imidazole glycerol-phosphate synthase subunit HisH
MSQPEVLIIATGIANVASMMSAFQRLGARPRLTQDPAEVVMGNAVVLPGVGAFGTGMARLRETGLGDAVRERVQSGKALLAVCLGLQLLCRSSEETPGVSGLSLFDATVTRLATSHRIPQLGWNAVEAPKGAEYLRSGYAYFANSYCVREIAGVECVATAEYGHSFVAAFEQGGLLACQFHPELSGQWGAGVLRRWLDRSVQGGKRL